MKHLLFGLLCITAISACNTKYEKTASGLAYKIIKGKGAKIEQGQIIKFNGIITVGTKDSVLNSTYGGLPVYQFVDTSYRRSHDYSEVLKYCSVGDSVIAIAEVDSLVKWGMMQYNGIFKRNDKITTKIKIIAAFKDQQAQMADYQKEIDDYTARDSKVVEDYLKKNKITAVKTKNGAYVEIMNAGEGMKADSGTNASVLYTGYLLKNNKAVDSNTDSTFGHLGAYSVAVGKAAVIKGWDESLPYFGKGGKGKVYVPSMLAYGPQGSPPNIGPYEHLYFNIEVVDVTKAVAPPPAPANPPVPPAPKSKK